MCGSVILLAPSPHGCVTCLPIGLQFGRKKKKFRVQLPEDQNEEEGQKNDNVVHTSIEYDVRGNKGEGLGAGTSAGYCKGSLFGSLAWI